VEAWALVSSFERQGFPPAGKSLPVLTTLSSRFSRGTMPALFRMAFCEKNKEVEEKININYGSSLISI